MPERRFRAVVADDEPMARDAVRTLLADQHAIEVVGEAASGAETVAVVRRLRPDLLFLDVQMPGGDGFAALDALGPDVPRGVVFVTAFDAHALRAFEVHALDYVVKPFGKPRFDAAVARAVARLEAEDALSLRRTLEALVAGTLAADAGTLARGAARPAALPPRPPLGDRGAGRRRRAAAGRGRRRCRRAAHGRRLRVARGRWDELERALAIG